MSKISPPYKQSTPETIQTMFASIAERYDRANAAFSFGLHKKWNRALIKSVGKGDCLLDLCAGTGDIAFGYLRRNPNAQAILLDFCPEMLAVAQKKGNAFEGRFSILEADAQQIPLKAGSVDVATISYGIRNVKDPEKCFQDVYRVLRPSGQFGILELTRPASSLLQRMHRLYLRYLLPILGKWAAKNIDAYHYLAESVQTFDSAEKLKEDLYKAGFSRVTCRPLMGGIATILVAEKTGG